MSIRIAFLGVEHSHALDKVKVVLENPDWELAGVWPEDAELRARYEKMKVRILTREQILNDRTIPVVAVESEVRHHDRDGLAALEAGKHIHLEKPPAASMAVVRKMADLAERKHLLLQTGYMWRYNPALNQAFEWVRQGKLGDVYFVRATMNTYIDDGRRPEWARFKGGDMYEQGSHLIDIVTRLLGRPLKVTSFLRKDGKFDDGLRDNTAAVLEYPRAMAIVNATTLQPNALPHRQVEILGTKATAVIRPIEPATLYLNTTPVEMPPYRRFVGDFAELAASVRDHKPLAVTLAQELLTQEIVLQASGM
jgi:predicted dehydrogenase